MVAAGLVLAVLAGSRIAGGDDPPEPAPRPTAAPPATDPLSYPRLGLRLERPRGWTADHRRGVIRLRAGDSTTSVTIVTAPRRIGPDRIAHAAREAAARSVSAPTVTGRSRLLLGSLPANATELRGRSRGGVELGVVVAAARGRWRTYALTIIRARTAPRERLDEIRSILESFRTHRPTKR